MTKKKIDKLSKQVERISTKRATIKESDDDLNAWRCTLESGKEIVDICTDVSYRNNKKL